MFLNITELAVFFNTASLNIKLSHFPFKLKLVNDTISLEALEKL